MVESVTARVSVLPGVGSELSTVYKVGNGTLDEVGLSVGQSCFRMDSDDTLPALQDERSIMSLLVLGRNCIMDISACGTLSPSDSVAAGPGGTDGPLSSSDWAGVLVPAVPTGIPFPVGPAGPVGLEGTLSPSDYVSGVLVDPGCHRPTLPGCCVRLCLLGYHSQWALLALLA